MLDEPLNIVYRKAGSLAGKLEPDSESYKGCESKWELEVGDSSVIIMTLAFWFLAKN